MPHVHNGLHHFTKEQAGYRAAVGEQDAAFTGIERAGETLTPILNIWERPEWAFPRGERLWAVSPSQSAVAAEFAQVGIINPTGSGHICVVDWAFGFNTAATAIRIEYRLGAQVTVDASAQPMPRDPRAGLIATGVGPLISFANSAAARIGSLLFQALSTTTGVWGPGCPPPPVVLTPGFFLALGPDTVNLGIAATLSGYVRPALPGELG